MNHLSIIHFQNENVSFRESVKKRHRFLGSTNYWNQKLPMTCWTIFVVPQKSHDHHRIITAFIIIIIIIIISWVSSPCNTWFQNQGENMPKNWSIFGKSRKSKLRSSSVQDTTPTEIEISRWQLFLHHLEISIGDEQLPSCIGIIYNKSL